MLVYLQRTKYVKKYEEHLLIVKSANAIAYRRHSVYTMSKSFDYVLSTMFLQDKLLWYYINNTFLATSNLTE